MPRIRIAVVAAGVLAATAPASPAHAGCSGAGLLPNGANAAKVRHATLCLLNAQRLAHGMSKLHGNDRLGHAAGGYAHLMARRNFFSHVSPTGSTPLSRIKRTHYL